ncbi:MAG: S8 family serine peptidase [Planctomycetes bacterium]|nr:S8 family serine peptidase [Planctomycetota bacterium]
MIPLLARTWRLRAWRLAALIALAPFARAQEPSEPTPLPPAPVTSHSDPALEDRSPLVEPARDGVNAGEGTVHPIDELDPSVPLPIPAVVVSGPMGDVEIQPASGDPSFLSFIAGPYYPPKSERIDPALLALRANRAAVGRPAEELFFCVMLSKRLSPQLEDEIRSLGARILGFVPHHSLRVAAEPAAIESLAGHPGVRWVGLPKAWQKVHPDLQQRLEKTLPTDVIDVIVTLHDGDLGAESTWTPVGDGMIRGTRPDGVYEERVDEQPIKRWTSNGWQQRRLQELGVMIDRYIEVPPGFYARIVPSQLDALLALDHVLFVEALIPDRQFHGESVPQAGADRARGLYPGDTNNAAMIGVIDSGLEGSGGTEPAHLALDHIFGWGWTLEGSPSPWDDQCGHGSHVAGTILGRPPVSTETHTGLAPNLGFAANRRIRNVKIFPNQTWGPCGSASSAHNDRYDKMRGNLDDGNGNISPPPHAINNSWGSSGSWTGTESQCVTLDSEVWVYDQLYCFAAGNDGSGAGTIGRPAVAKNAFTVGSLDDFENGAIDPGALSSFSSRGPCADGRWKPNLAAPGRWIRSVDARTDTNNNNYVDFQGTSMATPHITGIAGQLADHYDWLRYAPHRMAAVMMGTAATDGNIALTTEADAHLDNFGAGKIVAERAHFVEGDYGWLNWGFTQTNGWHSGDFTVPSGTTRLVVCMTYHEPAPTTGAGQALVKNIDLYIDRDPIDPAGNTGEYTAQQSSIDNTEIRHVVNPPAGPWRWKTWPTTASGSARVSVHVMFVTADDSPTLNLSVAAADQYVQPSEQVDVTATVSPSDYFAQDVFLESSGTTTGRTLHNVTAGLLDGRTAGLLDNQQAGLDVLVGTTEDDAPRDATWTVSYSTEGVKSFSVTGSADALSSVNSAVNITVDGTAPSAATGLASTTHTIGQWSNSRNLTFTWSQAADNLSGNDGYGEFWASTNPPGVGATRDFAATTTRSIAVTSDYDTLYYGLRTVDRSGNWSGTVSAGPYRIDTVEPSLPVNLASTSHTVSVWSNDNTIDFTWTTAVDDRSGIDGYGEAWGNAPGVGVANFKDLEENVFSRTITRGDGLTYYALKSVDNAGNWTATTREVGPFLIDTTAPAGPTGLSSSSHTVSTWSTLLDVTVNWNAATDASSGVSGYDIAWDQSPSTTLTGALNLGAGVTTTTRTLASSATGWYFHIAARDVAGNFGPTQHIGPFLLDDVTPAGPTNFASPSHTTGTWSNLAAVQATWTAATDAHSGIAGYDSLWDNAAGTIPAGALDLAAGATATSRALPSGASSWYLHLRARDNAANWGSTQHLGPFRIDTAAPTGSITIDGGNATCNGLSVNLALTAADALSGLAPSSIRLRNAGGAWGAWQPFAANLAWNLSTGGAGSLTGTRRVELEIRDGASNTLLVSDEIFYFVPVSYFGSSCAGSLGQPSFAITGIPGLGRNVAFVPGNIAAPIGAMYLGVSNTTWGPLPLPIDLGFLSPTSAGCSVNISLDVLTYSGGPIAIPVAIPADPLLAEAVLYFQWLYLGDPSGKLVVTTRGARMQIAGL